jgi:hypothetical protein
MHSAALPTIPICNLIFAICNKTRVLFAIRATIISATGGLNFAVLASTEPVNRREETPLCTSRIVGPL